MLQIWFTHMPVTYRVLFIMICYPLTFFLLQYNRILSMFGRVFFNHKINYFITTQSC